jgi:hypothetical protein
MLNTLVKKQRHWAIPLMVSLAFSWCLALCSGLANPAYAAAAELPPCHSMKATNVGPDMHSAASLDIEHDTCTGCDNQATPLDKLSLPAVILFVSWQPVRDIWPQSTAADVWFAFTPPPHPSVPLYLRKNLLLI